MEQPTTPLHRWVNLPPCLSNLSLCTFQSGTATPNVPVLAAFCDLAQDLPDLSSLQKVSIHMPVVSSSVGLPHPCQLIDLVREGMLNESLMNDAMRERLNILSLSSTFSLQADNLLSCFLQLNLVSLWKTILPPLGPSTGDFMPRECGRHSSAGPSDHPLVGSSSLLDAASLG